VSANTARQYFESLFVPVLVAEGENADALFTGYYEPEIHGSRHRHGIYSTPIYGEPDDLVSADLGLFRDDLKGEHVTGRVFGHTFVPYFTRAQIDAGGMSHAPVLLYADDPVQVFFLHIQGSGRARLENGTFVRLTYAGQNGRPYTAVGHTLIAEGAIDRTHMSMQAIRGWMRTHPDAARATMESDQSFVFFRLAPLGDPALGSPGSEGVPLTPEASIAIDEHFHPLGTPFFVAARSPDVDPAKPDHPLNRLFVGQDTGGAIKGAARADVFWGFGDDAESIAGRMKSTGHLYVLLPKALAARISPQPAFGAP
jgi:membrane-bound lytic murein transglycosylase A